MNVYEIRLKIYMLKNIYSSDIQSEICSLMDNCLAKDTKWLNFHNENKFKDYCFDSMYPLEIDKIYKCGNIYTLTIRTINKDLANYFNNNLPNEYNQTIKGLTSQVRIIPKKIIEKIYSLTPVILKDDNGYWKNNLLLSEFENILKSNLIKKYNSINNTKIDENFELYTSIEFKNKKPIAIKYKDIKLLGDKISLNISDEKIAQEIAYMALGTGIMCNCSRGAGFMNFRYL